MTPRGENQHSVGGVRKLPKAAMRVTDSYSNDMVTLLMSHSARVNSVPFKPGEGRYICG